VWGLECCLWNEATPDKWIEQGRNPVFGGMELWNWWISGNVTVATKRRLGIVQE